MTYTPTTEDVFVIAQYGALVAAAEDGTPLDEPVFLTMLERWLESVRAAAWADGVNARSEDALIRRSPAETLARNPHAQPIDED